jgi:hypothetical protein
MAVVSACGPHWHGAIVSWPYTVLASMALERCYARIQVLLHLQTEKADKYYITLSSSRVFIGTYIRQFYEEVTKKIFLRGKTHDTVRKG